MNAELYQDIVLQYARSRKHCGRLEHPTHHARGVNAACGDELSLDVKIVDGRIEAMRYDATACAICTASAAIMASALTGADTTSARGAVAGFRCLATMGASACPLPPACEALGGVHVFPMRVKCATLPWETLDRALAEA